MKLEVQVAEDVVIIGEYAKLASFFRSSRPSSRS